MKRKILFTGFIVLFFIECLCVPSVFALTFGESSCKKTVYQASYRANENGANATIRDTWTVNESNGNITIDIDPSHTTQGPYTMYNVISWYWNGDRYAVTQVKSAAMDRTGPGEQVANYTHNPFPDPNVCVPPCAEMFDSAAAECGDLELVVFDNFDTCEYHCLVCDDEYNDLLLACGEGNFAFNNETCEGYCFSCDDEFSYCESSCVNRGGIAYFTCDQDENGNLSSTCECIEDDQGNLVLADPDPSPNDPETPPDPNNPPTDPSNDPADPAEETGWLEAIKHNTDIMIDQNDTEIVYLSNITDNLVNVVENQVSADENRTNDSQALGYKLDAIENDVENMNDDINSNLNTINSSIASLDPLLSDINNSINDSNSNLEPLLENIDDSINEGNGVLGEILTAVEAGNDPGPDNYYLEDDDNTTLPADNVFDSTVDSIVEVSLLDSINTYILSGLPLISYIRDSRINLSGASSSMSCDLWGSVVEFDLSPMEGILAAMGYVLLGVSMIVGFGIIVGRG